MKTVSELNSKWWYRLLKVSWLFFALIGIISAITISWNNNGSEFDPISSKVVCNDGRHFPVDKIGMHSEFSVYSFDETFRTWCSTEMVNDNGVLKLKKIDGTISPEKNYAFIAEHTPHDWVGFIWYSLLSIFCIYFVFEVIRRIFYYVILGSIFPALDSESPAAQQANSFRSIPGGKGILIIEAVLIFIVVGGALSWLLKFVLLGLVVSLNISSIEAIKDIDDLFSIASFVIGYLVARKRYRRRSLESTS